MLNEEDYSSDTSDEDFVPEGLAESEDDHEDDNEDIELDEDNEQTTLKGKKRKVGRNARPNKRKKADKHPWATSSEDVVPDKEAEPVDEVKQAVKEKSLWDDFLADVEEPKENPKPKPKSSWASLLNTKKKSSPDSTSSQANTATSTSTATKASAAQAKTSQPSTVKITKVFEFAGEEVRVEKEVASDSVEAKVSKLSENGNSSLSDATQTKNKRPLGLSNIVGLLDSKKEKLSTLEKSKLDWMSFKSSEGIEDELSTHLRSKEGFLEKQAFLERTDIRQFEIERNMRMSKSKR